MSGENKQGMSLFQYGMLGCMLLITVIVAITMLGKNAETTFTNTPLNASGGGGQVIYQPKAAVGGGQSTKDTPKNNSTQWTE